MLGEFSYTQEISGAADRDQSVIYDGRQKRAEQAECTERKAEVKAYRTERNKLEILPSKSKSTLLYILMP